jgi:hypothetical protein
MECRFVKLEFVVQKSCDWERTSLFYVGHFSSLTWDDNLKTHQALKVIT